MKIFPLIDSRIDTGTDLNQVLVWNSTTKRFEVTLTPSGLTSIGTGSLTASGLVTANEVIITAPTGNWQIGKRLAPAIQSVALAINHLAAGNAITEIYPHPDNKIGDVINALRIFKEWETDLSQFNFLDLSSQTDGSYGIRTFVSGVGMTPGKLRIFTNGNEGMFDLETSGAITSTAIITSGGFVTTLLGKFGRVEVDNMFLDGDTLCFDPNGIIESFGNLTVTVVDDFTSTADSYLFTSINGFTVVDNVIINGEVEAGGVVTKAKITAIGGYAIKLTNKTGSNTVQGQLVKPDTANDDAFITIAANDQEIIGIVLEAGVSDGSEAWVVVNGIADVLMDSGGSARGDRIISSATAGSGDVWNVGGAVATHFQEIGHCLETRVGAGLARVNIHLN